MMPRRTANPVTRVAAVGGGQRPAIQTVTDALASHPGRSATEVAALTGLGGSTVTKALAALERAGRARRETPEPVTGAGGRRPAAHWYPTAGAGTSADPAFGDDDTPVRAATPAAPSGRLGKGQLGELVLEYLIVHAGTDLGPTAIGKALARSQGAVANCLTKLATSGDIVQTSDKPRRYRPAS